MKLISTRTPEQKGGLRCRRPLRVIQWSALRADGGAEDSAPALRTLNGIKDIPCRTLFAS